jgi:hypothetical protein
LGFASAVVAEESSAGVVANVSGESSANAAPNMPLNIEIRLRSCGVSRHPLCQLLNSLEPQDYSLLMVDQQGE